MSRADALAIYAAAVRAVDPAAAVARALRTHPLPDAPGPTWVIGAGKAALAMERGVRDVLGDDLRGLLVAPRTGPSVVPVIEGDHPVPAERSLAAGEALLRTARALPAGARVLGLWSGGASALAVAPTVPLHEVVAAQARLTAEGADIRTLNTWRIAHSRLKGGALRRAAPQSRPWHNLVISDVLDDDPALVGSGPGITADAPGQVVSCRRDALAGAEAEAWGLRYAVTVLSDRVHGDAGEEGARLGHALGLRFPGQPPLALLAVGEPVVRLPADAPPGGRMQHAALAAALAIAGTDAVVLCAGTDGRDGPTEAAGALVDGGTTARIRAAGIQPEDALARAHAHRALAAAGDLLPAAPTGTNVGDLLVGLCPAVSGTAAPTPPAGS